MNIYWIDLFADAGGTTTGIEMANAQGLNSLSQVS